MAMLVHRLLKREFPCSLLHPLAHEGRDGLFLMFLGRCSQQAGCRQLPATFSCRKAARPCSVCPQSLSQSVCVVGLAEGLFMACLQESVTELAAGSTLNVGQTLASPGGAAKLVFQEDGNLVVRSHASTQC